LKIIFLVYYLTIWLISPYCILFFFFFSFRDGRNNRVALFDGIEEGGIRASSLYSTSHEIDEHDNEQALDGLQDRVNLLKRVSLLLLATCPRFLVISCIFFVCSTIGKHLNVYNLIFLYCHFGSER